MPSNTRSSMTRRNILTLAAGGVAAVALATWLPRMVMAQGAAPGAPLKIGIIGSGHIGSTLGTLWAKAGHPVFFSSRHPEELKGLVEGLGPMAHAGSVQEAIAFGDVVFIAVPYAAMAQIGKENGPVLAQKALVFDASNPIARRDGEAAAQAEQMGGGGLATAQLLPGSHVVRGFNAIGYAQVTALAARTSDKAGMPIAGDDKRALDIASGLVRDAGLEPVVVGGLAMGKYLVPGTPLAGEHSPDQIRQIAATLH